jgi:hypothetical protein
MSPYGGQRSRSLDLLMQQPCQMSRTANSVGFGRYADDGTCRNGRLSDAMCAE